MNAFLQKPAISVTGAHYSRTSVLRPICEGLFETSKEVAVRSHLHPASESMMQQLCDDANDSVLIENNGVAPECHCNPFSGNSIVSMRTESLGSWQSCRSVESGAWCKWALKKNANEKAYLTL